MGNLAHQDEMVLQEVYPLRPGYMLADMTEERAELVAEFKCSLFDDLVIHLEDVFDRVK